MLIRKWIKELVDELDPAHFAQVHRATIVNLHRVERLERSDSDYLTLRFGDCVETIRVSRSYAPLFRQM